MPVQTRVCHVVDATGLDVARKVVILARECGMEVELESMAVESLVPAQLQGEGVSAAQYMEALPQVGAWVERC